MTFLMRLQPLIWPISSRSTATRPVLRMTTPLAASFSKLRRYCGNVLRYGPETKEHLFDAPKVWALLMASLTSHESKPTQWWKTLESRMEWIPAPQPTSNRVTFFWRRRLENVEELLSLLSSTFSLDKGLNNLRNFSVVGRFPGK